MIYPTADTLIAALVEEGIVSINPGGGYRVNSDRWANKTADIEAIYWAYPKHVARARALKAIEQAVGAIARRDRISRTDAAAWLLERVRLYAGSAYVRTRPQYVPHPASWMNGGQYDDDASEWGEKPTFAPARETAMDRAGRAESEQMDRWGSVLDLFGAGDDAGRTEEGRPDDQWILPARGADRDADGGDCGGGAAPAVRARRRGDQAALELGRAPRLDRDGGHPETRAGDPRGAARAPGAGEVAAAARAERGVEAGRGVADERGQGRAQADARPARA